MAAVNRAVLDTNVLARAARGGDGAAAELVRRLTQPPHVLVLSPFLLAELTRVLRYERVRALHGLDEAGMDDFVETLQTAAFLVNPAADAAIAVVPHDPDDNPVVAAAREAKASVLCTRDRHLQHADVQTYCAQHNIRIMGDVDLLQLLREKEAGESTQDPPQA